VHGSVLAKAEKMAVIIAFFLIMCRLVTLYVRGGFIYLKYIVIVEHRVFDPWALPKAITIQAGLGAKTELEWEKFQFSILLCIRQLVFLQCSCSKHNNNNN